MTINEGTINHNAARLCEDVSEEIWDIVLDNVTAEKKIHCKIRVYQRRNRHGKSNERSIKDQLGRCSL